MIFSWVNNLLVLPLRRKHFHLARVKDCEGSLRWREGREAGISKRNSNNQMTAEDRLIGKYEETRGKAS